MASVPVPLDSKTSGKILGALSKKAQAAIEVLGDVSISEIYLKYGEAESTFEVTSRAVIPSTSLYSANTAAVPPGWARMSKTEIGLETGAPAIFVSTVLVLAWAGMGLRP